MQVVMKRNDKGEALSAVTIKVLKRCSVGLEVKEK